MPFNKRTNADFIDHVIRLEFLPVRRERGEKKEEKPRKFLRLDDSRTNTRLRRFRFEARRGQYNPVEGVVSSYFDVILFIRTLQSRGSNKNLSPIA